MRLPQNFHVVFLLPYADCSYYYDTLIRSLLKELEYFVKKVVRATPTF